MAIIVPSGAPAWTRTATHETYGGNLEKVNHQGMGTIDPQTDISAENWTRLALDMAACANTAPALMMRFRFNDTVPAPPTVLYAVSMWGSTGTYESDNPPPFFPTGVRDGNSRATWSVPEEGFLYPDSYGVTAGWQARHAQGNVIYEGIPAALKTSIAPDLLPPTSPFMQTFVLDDNQDDDIIQNALCEVVIW